MCGRFTRKEQIKALLDVLKAVIRCDLSPSYNIAPSQMVPCVRNAPENGYRECVLLKWGLIPSWAKDPSIGYKMINARAETVAEKPSFRKAFLHQRCLVIADGFYEWKREGKAKRPYYIRFKDSRPFAFAGLWESWKDPSHENGRQVDSCTIITIEANEFMQPIHHRMPVILNLRNYDVWLDPAIKDVSLLFPLLKSNSSEEMADELEAFPISTRVNNPQFDGPECIEPI
jgi:putative SOS response-associated peptidase YedK